MEKVSQWCSPKTAVASCGSGERNRSIELPSIEHNLFVNKIEQMLGDAASAVAGGGMSVQKLTAARQDWVKSRDSAIKEITNLSKAIVAAFAKETAQAPAVKDAIKKP